MVSHEIKNSCWFSDRVKLNSCVVRIKECEDHVIVSCADGSEYKVCSKWYKLIVNKHEQKTDGN